VAQPPGGTGGRVPPSRYRARHGLVLPTLKTWLRPCIEYRPGALTVESSNELMEFVDTMQYVYASYSLTSLVIRYST
jgi:hypothetical protein